MGERNGKWEGPHYAITLLLSQTPLPPPQLSIQYFSFNPQCSDAKAEGDWVVASFKSQTY